MRFRQNLAGFANAFPAPAPETIFVAGRMGNPAGGLYFTVRYMVLNEVRTTTMWFAKDPTAEELAIFKTSLANIAEQQSWFTAETDWQAQADMGYEQYIQWVMKQREGA